VAEPTLNVSLQDLLDVYICVTEALDLKDSCQLALEEFKKIPNPWKDVRINCPYILDD
jgi:hypothetical protein